ncbi:hypothetical protein MtrunA17_Chr4g0064491 [Medicago truncatula]|uniref:Uncharacterized protein n=1 Tax=Medicago truncatula TaxID=3880 RepID=A0A396IM77_MEDTR|nr:hypothetical protein MtrunA17_Chr4g0064491 [Medicago truncatula]
MHQPQPKYEIFDDYVLLNQTNQASIFPVSASHRTKSLSSKTMP